jgi:hypothetical protein
LSRDLLRSDSNPAKAFNQAHHKRLVSLPVSGTIAGQATLLQVLHFDLQECAGSLRHRHQLFGNSRQVMLLM